PPLRPSRGPGPAAGPLGPARSGGGGRRLPGGGGALRRPPGGLPVRDRGLELLPHEEPGGAGRRRGRPAPRRRPGVARAPTAQRRPERPLPARGRRPQQPPRRDAGRHPARGPPAPAGLDGAPARAGCRLLPRAGGRQGHAARGAAVRHGGVPPVRGPAPSARRAHGPAEGARRGDAHPLPHPAPPPARLRLPPWTPARLSGGRGGRARDPVPPAPSRDDRRRRPLRGRGGAGAVIAHIVPAAAAVLAAPFLFLVPGLVVLALVRREDRQALEPDEGLFLAVALSVMASAWVGLVLAEAGRF